MESQYPNFLPENSQITKRHSEYYFFRYSRDCTLYWHVVERDIGTDSRTAKIIDVHNELIQL